jgi:DNA-binding GntR family transcriptional regulator
MTHPSPDMPAPETRTEPLAKSSGTLHGELLPALRNYIVEGHLQDGARVPERALCERFQVSRTPLREALKVLAAEGLIELLPNRGARIRQLAPEEIKELFELMGGLEALAGRLACERITDEEITEIEHAHHEMYRHYINGNLQGYFQFNQNIHRLIVTAARNSALSMAYDSVSGRIKRARYSANQTKERDRWGEAMREHEAILDALRRRAGGELANIMFQHLRNKQKAAQSTTENGSPA